MDITMKFEEVILTKPKRIVNGNRKPRKLYPGTFNIHNKSKLKDLNGNVTRNSNHSLIFNLDLSRTIEKNGYQYFHLLKNINSASLFIDYILCFTKDKGPHGVKISYSGIGGNRNVKINNVQAVKYLIDVLGLDKEKEEFNCKHEKPFIKDGENLCVKICM